MIKKVEAIPTFQFDERGVCLGQSGYEYKVMDIAEKTNEIIDYINNLEEKHEQDIHS